VSGAIGLLLACLLLLMPAAGSENHLAILSLFWGVAIMIIGLGMQVKVLALAPDATDVAMSLFSGILIWASARARWWEIRLACMCRCRRLAIWALFRPWSRLSGQCSSSANGRWRWRNKVSTGDVCRVALRLPGLQACNNPAGEAATRQITSVISFNNLQHAVNNKLHAHTDQ
jgi:hypothetical protein